MRRGFVLLAILCLVAAGTAFARTTQAPLLQQMMMPGDRPDGVATTGGEYSRQDTLWFGGDDGTGHALFSPDLGDPDAATWTWDSGSTDPFEGWTSQDMTENDGVYFSRVTSASFAGDPCTPMFPGETGELWCGAHEAYADGHDWIGGMGYGENWCLSSYSPYLTCAGQKQITTTFKFFQKSEPNFDYTYLYVLAYDNAATPNLLEEIYVTDYDGVVGSYTAPVTQTKVLAAAELPTNTAKVRIEWRFDSDGGWSDQDGSYVTPCGPFAVDDIAITVQGSAVVNYDFTASAEGWTFAKCPGIGAFMAVWPEDVWTDWVTTVNLTCGCTLSGNALGCIDETSPFPVPGHPAGQIEQLNSGTCVLDRDLYSTSDYNTTFAQYDAYFYLRKPAGSFYRPGYKYYPYTTTVNPVPHWSQRLGQDGWYHTGLTPFCTDDNRDGLTAQGLSRDWEEMKFIFEFVTSCAMFGIDPPNCRFEGQTYGAPLIDNVRVGIFGSLDAPLIALDSGHQFMDGFGQNFPTYLEPGDVGNSDVSYDISRDDPALNDWNADSAMVTGPMPTGTRTWLCNLVFRMTSKGPRQDMIPGYQFWKSRLQGDPETGWVAVLMDSAQATATLVSNQAFSTYFHENDPGYRGPTGVGNDYGELNEILPDGVFTPGTAISYYYAPYWTSTPQIQGHYPNGGNWEFQILPNMTLAQGSDWDVEWPSVLYVDAFNRGSEVFITPVLQQLNLVYDKFDALDRASNYDSPLMRSFKSGAWGNNGCTVQQFLGYRMVLYNTGTFDADAIPAEDFMLIDLWLDATDCPEAGAVRRGLILNGDNMAAIMDDPDLGVAADLMNLKLGAAFVAESYRDYNNDDYNCVGVLQSGSSVFQPASPGAAVYGNACPTIYTYNVLGTHATGGVASVGNALFKSYNPSATNPTVEFAQVVRDMSNQPSANWKSAVDGFSFHHLSEYAGAGNECSTDSVRIVDGTANVMGPELLWIADVNDPFVLWQYPCEDAAVGEDTDGHLAGAVNYLYQSRPNPFRSSATIRFNLAQAGHVDLTIYDVTGRTVKTLVNGDLLPEPGGNSVVWDGTDNSGSRVSGGIFWTQMSTNGFTSSKKMVVLR